MIVRLMKAIVIVLALMLNSQSIAAAKLQETLNHYLHRDGVDAEPSEYFLRIIPPHGKSPKMEIVYLHSNDWCGTSGCTLLIIANERGTRKEVGGFTTQLPMWSLGRSKSDYPIFRVRHYGGGSMTEYCGTLRFNGGKYFEEVPRPLKGGCKGGLVLIDRK